jgi:hypothetical protein
LTSPIQSSCASTIRTSSCNLKSTTGDRKRQDCSDCAPEALSPSKMAVDMQIVTARPFDATYLLSQINQPPVQLFSDLCSICRLIDLDTSKFSWVDYRRIPSESRNLLEPWRDLGSAKDIEGRSFSCRLCHLIFTIIQARCRKSTSIDDQSTFYLRRRYSYGHNIVSQEVPKREQERVVHFSRLLLSRSTKAQPGWAIIL